MQPLSDSPKAVRSLVDNHFHAYLVEGGFPEAQGLQARDRLPLLRSYVDVAILCDVIDRHGVSNPAALRGLQRHLLSNPAASFSVEKFHNSLKSQGIAVGKNTVHDYLSHIEDAFLVRTVLLHTASLRKQLVNPRKAYPIDPGLIPLYERMGRENLGKALETAVLLELERQGCEIGYIRTSDGYEVDFHARYPDGKIVLIQVSADIADPATCEREVRALRSAAESYPEATLLLLTADDQPPAQALPAPLRWQSAAAWLLGDPLNT